MKSLAPVRMGKCAHAQREKENKKRENASSITKTIENISRDQGSGEKVRTRDNRDDPNEKGFF